jgi:Uma2 family endonuclease
MSVQHARRYFTVSEFEQMGRAGILKEDDRVELVEGEIYEMSPIGKRHAACVARLTRILTQLLQNRAIIWVQNPIRLNDFSEPQPDLCVLKPREDFYEGALPGPADVLLVIEVSDTTLEYDRQVKVPLYARAGVPEAWVVNLADGEIETYSHPAGGVYTVTDKLARGGEARSQSVEGLAVEVSRVLP